MDQRRGGGLPVRARHRNDLGHLVELLPIAGRERPEKQRDIIVHRHTGLNRRRDHTVRLRIKMRNAGRHNQRGYTFKRALLAQIDNLQPVFGRLRPRVFIVVPTQGLRAAGNQRLRRRQPRAPQPQHGHLEPNISQNRYHNAPSLAFPCYGDLQESPRGDLGGSSSSRREEKSQGQLSGCPFSGVATKP